MGWWLALPGGVCLKKSEPILQRTPTKEASPATPGCIGLAHQYEQKMTKK